MSSFTPRLLSPEAAEPDPTKHVNYSLGMVLGVDDFTQEFAYLSGRDQWLARDLLGYGTVSGLSVGLEVEATGPQVSVTPGVALSPRGRLIRVAPGQCARLNGWLAAHRAELLSLLGSPEDNRASLRLFVVLGYRECPTDMIPIPGQPCRSEDETTAASRLADDFSLELRLNAPDQLEEDALRDFVAWLGQVEITDAPDAVVTVAEFEEAIRRAAYLDTAPPSEVPPDFMYGSPPETLRIHTSLAYEHLRAAFRVWVTELRPRWQPRWVGKGQGCSGAAQGGSPRADDCLLLAELHLRLVRTGSGADWQVVDDADGVSIHEERRPYLMHLRMVQEWLLGERRVAQEAGAGHRGWSVEGDSPPQPSIVPGFSVTPETTFGLTPESGMSLDYARADHTHGTPPPPALAGDVTGDIGATTVERIRSVEVDVTTPNDGQVLTYDGAQNRWSAADAVRPANAVTPETAHGLTPAVGSSLDYARADHTHGTPPPPPPPVLAGDATGPVGATVVARIQGVVVNPATPADGQVLAYDGTLKRWSGKSLPAAAQPPAASDSVVGETAFGLAANAGSSTAYSRADHTHGTPPAPPPPVLAGDVTGPAGTTVVSKIQGVNVSPTAPVGGQVLTYVAAQNRWSGVAPPAAGGDASGPVGNMTVSGIQGRKVLPTAPAHSQVLAYDGAQGAWAPANMQAQSGDFVLRPAGQPAYTIVAAGIVRGDDEDTAPGDRFNNLRVRRVETGRINVTFDGYADPASKGIQYIVKAMAVAAPDLKLSGIVVNFEGFLKTAGIGFTLLVTSNQEPVGGDMLKRMQFMIEVSQYDFKVSRTIEEK